jgi:hypothetical protein
MAPDRKTKHNNHPKTRAGDEGCIGEEVRPVLFGGSSKEGIVARTPEGLAEFGQWSNSTMEYYYSGPPRAIHLSWIDI